VVTVQRFYRISIWLPVIVALAAGLVLRVLIVAGTRPGGAVEGLLMLLSLSGVLYIPFALLATWWIRKCDEYDIRRVMFVMPLLMTAVAFLVSVVMMLIGGGMSAGLEVAAAAMTLILPIGYAWVLVIVLLRLLVRPTDEPHAHP
jgi:hypothetical protein